MQFVYPIRGPAARSNGPYLREKTGNLADHRAGSQLRRTGVSLMCHDAHQSLANLRSSCASITRVSHLRVPLATALVLGVTLSIAGCTVAEPPATGRPASGTTGPKMPERAQEAPEWLPGDRWTFEWTSGKDTGTKTIEVLETREVNSVNYYVTRLVEVQHFYTRELHWAAAVRDGRVEARMNPPQRWFSWPLEVGARWRFQGAFELLNGQTTHDDSFTVLAIDTVEVPAGRFPAFRILRQGQGADSDEYWYAPAVRWYARWIGRRSDASFEERLREYIPAPRPPRPSPSGTR